MKTPTTVLLVVIAVLLAVNLIPATAQQPPDFLDPPDSEPSVVGITATQFHHGALGDIHWVYRLWSDGMVERNQQFFSGNWQGWTTVPE